MSRFFSVLALPAFVIAPARAGAQTIPSQAPQDVHATETIHGRITAVNGPFGEAFPTTACCTKVPSSNPSGSRWRPAWR
ncbi:MAG: hypothetical protein ABR591_03005 [Candidatus Velthaea sp.]